jgi:2-isopropylmalate synthase
VTLLEFAINAVTEGIDALGEVTVRIQRTDNGDKDVINPQSDEPVSRTFGGHSAETDIVVASAKAYLSALNKLLVAHGYEARPEGQQEPEKQLVN